MSKKQNSNSPEENTLEYIKISHKNNIEELSSDEHINEVSNIINSISMTKGEVCEEINKYCQTVIPGYKEPDLLKLIISISSKSKVDKDQFEYCLNEIMNRPESNFLILTKDLYEQLSIVLKEIFKKIKKNYSKIKTFEQIIEESQKYLYNYNQDDILKKYKTQKISSNNNEETNASFNHSEKRLFSFNKNKDFQSISSNSLTQIKINKQNNCSNTQNETIYKFKKFKEDSKYNLPVEMLILMRKFNMINRLKFTIDNNNINRENYFDDNIESGNSEIVLDQNDLQNTIFVLYNLKWLFPSVLNLEIDLSNKNLMQHEITLYKKTIKKFGKLLHKDVKITTYISNSNNNYYPINEDSSSDKFSNLSQSASFSQANSNNNLIILEQKDNLDKFIRKYKALLEMIIIYGYFIPKISKIIRLNLILPINFGYEISEMLKLYNLDLDLNDFHFLSFLNNTEIIHSTINFNSLDNQTFKKIIYFLKQNQNIHICNLYFFPPEEYFKTELLFKLLQTCDKNYLFQRGKNNEYIFDKNLILDLKCEDLDTYILKKLSKYFEKNIADFFYLLTIKGTIYELNLNFNSPTILSKIDYYNNILMKFILDLLIFIDKSLNNIKKLMLKSENFIFDSKKNPILNNFFDNLSLYSNKDIKLEELKFQVKFYNINNIHNLIPFNLTNLSLGSFDYITFSNLVKYLTSGEFNNKSKLKKIKLKLNNSVFEINKVYEIIIKLLTEYPKGLTEIKLYTYLSITNEQLMNLLSKTNYNTLDYIFIQFSVKSIKKDKKLQEKLECDLTGAGKDICIKVDDFVQLYMIERNKKITTKIINLMIGLSKINRNIMKYSIYSIIERYFYSKVKKKVTIQFKP